MARLNWGPILEEAKAWVESHATGVILRQVFYHLVSVQLIPNSQLRYAYLSSVTAAMRRAGTFPRLVDETREISQRPFWLDARDAQRAIATQYLGDRQEGQPWQIWLGAEKRGMRALLDSWFGEYNLRTVAIAGYAPQTIADDVHDVIDRDGRPAVLIYAGDLDPTGEDITRDFIKRVNAFDDVVQVALTPDQARLYNLPPNPGKPGDPRNKGFAAKHGSVFQIEVDALDPDVLQALYRGAIDGYLDMSRFEQAKAAEELERSRLQALVASL